MHGEPCQPASQHPRNNPIERTKNATQPNESDLKCRRSKGGEEEEGRSIWCVHGLDPEVGEGAGDALPAAGVGVGGPPAAQPLPRRGVEGHLELQQRLACDRPSHHMSEGLGDLFTEETDWNAADAVPYRPG